MKTIKITVLFFVLSISLQAQEVFNQTAQGNWLANGTVRIFNTTTKAKLDGTTNKVASTFEIQAGPKAGYFVIDNLAVGLETFISSTSTKFESLDDRVTTSAVFVAPFARYYIYEGIF